MAYIDLRLNETNWLELKNKYQDSMILFLFQSNTETLTKKLTRINSKYINALRASYRSTKLQFSYRILPRSMLINGWHVTCIQNLKREPLTCARRKRPSSKDGLMTIGPYVELPPGQYVGSITYSYAMPNDECNATWDVVAHYKDSTQIVEAGTVQRQQVSASSHLPLKYRSGAQVEIRTLVGKTRRPNSPEYKY